MQTSSLFQNIRSVKFYIDLIEGVLVFCLCGGIINKK